MEVIRYRKSLIVVHIPCILRRLVKTRPSGNRICGILMQNRYFYFFFIDSTVLQSVLEEKGGARKFFLQIKRFFTKILALILHLETDNI